MNRESSEVKKDAKLATAPGASAPRARPHARLRCAAWARLQSVDRAGVPDALVGTERLHDAFAM